MSRNQQSRKNTKDNLILTLLLCAITAACVLLWYFGTLHHFYNRVDYREISSDNGTYDLSDIDFENTVIRVSGSAQFIPDTLLTPEEFNARAGEIQTGKMEGHGSVSTTRVRLIFPSADESALYDTYMLAWSSSNYAETLYINGEPRGSAGQPGESKDEEEAGHVFWYYSVKPEGGAVEIVRQISNFVHRAGGGHASIFVGSEENIRLFVSLRTDFEGITVGLLLALFFVHLTLYFILRSYRANLWLAVLCLAWALQTGFAGTNIFMAVFPVLTWETAFRIGYLSVPAGIILVVLIVGELFPAVSQKWPVRVIIGASAIFGFLYLFADTLLMSQAAFWCNVLYIAVIIWLAVRFIIKLPGLYRRRELLPEHFASLFGLAVFLYAVVHDAFYYNNIHLFGINSSLTDLGLLVFSVSQTVAMSRGTMREVAAAQEREKTLTKEKMELESRLIEEQKKPHARIIKRGSMTLDTVSQKASIDGTDMHLTQKEFNLLLLFVQNEEKILSKEYLFETIWKQPLAGDSNALWKQISNLKIKLDKHNVDFILTSKRNEGYSMIIM